MKYPLSEAERRALHAAAKAGGFSRDFGDLLCQLAEAVGFERILNELEKVEAELAGLGPPWPPEDENPEDR